MTKISAAAAAAREAARNTVTGQFGPQSHTPPEGHDLPGTGESTMTVDEYGNRLWRNAEGRMHRTDGPALEWEDGSRAWWVNGKPHREDGPAVEDADGTRKWFQHGKLHREEGPAVEGANGTRKWLQHGVLHREDGPAIEYADGTTEWWIHGKQVPAPGEPESVMRVTVDDAREWRDLEDDLHRADGPAIEQADGTREWYRHGELHREDGSAVELADGHREWWVDGVRQRVPRT